MMNHCSMFQREKSQPTKTVILVMSVKILEPAVTETKEGVCVDQGLMRRMEDAVSALILYFELT